MKILIDTIPHTEQRYPTVGDWYFEELQLSSNPEDKPEQVLRIRVSEMSDWRHEACVAIHELAEVLMCKQAGITTEQVDFYDKNYEKLRAEGLLPDPNSEPGDEPEAPYFRQHVVASAIERLLAGEMEVDWNKYADEVEAFP